MTWSYDLPDNSFDFLAAGEILTLTYTATVDDHHGGVVSTPITVTVTGTNDAPAITAIAQRDLDEQTDTSTLTATIPVTFTDVDLSDVGHTAAVTHAVASGVTTGLGSERSTLDRADDGRYRQQGVGFVIRLAQPRLCGCFH